MWRIINPFQISFLTVLIQHYHCQYAASVGRLNTKTNTSKIVFFMILSSSPEDVLKLHTVLIFTALGLSLQIYRWLHTIWIVSSKKLIKDAIKIV